MSAGIARQSWRSIPLPSVTEFVGWPHMEQLAGGILSQAADVFGSREDAAEWLMLPAMALNQNRPIDLLATNSGCKQVELLLIPLLYGIYT